MMPTVPNYDFSPVLHLLLLGAALAAGPIAWVWWRKRSEQPRARLQALVVLTLFLTFDLVLFGAFTRLTDSGLGCPDWPGCYGSASPVGAHGEIAQAQAQMPTGPVTHRKAWIEMVHRYLASSVGALIIVMVAMAWMLRRAGEADVGLGLPMLTLLWVCMQGAFGALTVTMKLFPAIVTLHLLGGYGLLVLLTMQAVRGQAQRPAAPAPALRSLAALATAMLVLQALSGAWVSTNYAVLACADFPTCHGSWWPEMDFNQALSLWRPLGTLADGTPLSTAGITAIHFMHRLLALVTVLVLACTAWRLHVAGLRQGRWLAGLLALQVLTGVSNVVLGWPLLAALLHTGGAGAMLVVLTSVLAVPQVHAAQRRVPAGAWEGAR
ncbi:COX15/CtaA family protein [Curvibacter sp. APW13]|uniref:COX15/CtaA family protein n=1 Tax=Curvibacter sp. APW13 TaxID=3077236 RepID=UPI0028DFCA73|nr:COX15/CtaA family protein [Curvibacter sp. APW13]MDT8989652.1 COX15/CtaA family protein [Curvibacter sp. APW13]